MSSTRQPVEPGTHNSSQAVAEQLRRFVLDRRLQPGDRIGREADLAREFRVSRPTLREALRLLSSEHLVRASKGPGGGIFVAATPEQGIGLSVSAAVATMLDAHSIGLDELLETRLLLEVPLAGLAAARACEQDIADLRGLLVEIEAAAARDEHAAELDARLHQMIARIAGNRLAGSLTSWIFEVFQPRLAVVIAPAVVETVIAEQHRELIGALLRREPLAAERAMREHLVYMRDLLSVVEDPLTDTARDGSSITRTATSNF